MKILVVDDEEDVISMFRQRFRRELRAGTLDLVFAQSGDAALGTLADGTHADVVLILSDINMPGMNGLELLRILKERDPGRPVVMVSAYDNDENKRIALDRAADGYINKPVDFDQLRTVIGRLTADPAGMGDS
jgi:two-component system, chemotaxis family, chemotaxis protein CheY